MYFGVTFISSFDIFFVSAIYQQNDTQAYKDERQAS